VSWIRILHRENYIKSVILFSIISILNVFVIDLFSVRARRNNPIFGDNFYLNRIREFIHALSSGHFYRISDELFLFVFLILTIVFFSQPKIKKYFNQKI
jgi:hypothetical protein